MAKENLSERYEKSSYSERESFEEVISHITYDRNLDDHEDWILALLTGYSILSEENFHLLSELAADSPLFDEKADFQFFYYLARGNYFRKKMVLHHALENFEYAFKTAQKTDLQNHVIKALINIAGIYFLNKDYDWCEQYTKQAIALAVEEQSQILLADLYNGLCALYLVTGNFNAAYNSGSEALEHYCKLEHYENLLNYSICLLNCGDACFHLGDRDKSKTFYDMGINLAEKNDYLDQIQNNLEDIADFYHSEGEHVKAFRILKAYKAGAFVVQRASEKLENQITKQQLKIEIDNLISLRKDNQILQKRIDHLKDQFRYYQNPMAERKDMMDDLILALKNNEITTYYQPKVLVDSKEIVGAEALVRWERPNGDPVTPDQFIPVIENTYLIQDITEKVIKDAFSFCRVINNSINPDFSMSINIAPSQLHDSTLAYMLKKELLVSGVPPGNIELEIIERTLLDQNSHVESSLKKLRSLGVSFSLDDFGIGYSSLSMLNRDLFSSVKIDRSLLMSAPANEKAELLLRGIIALLESMGYAVVAEGLEDEKHYNLVLETNCTYGQGYYFSRPVSEEDFYALLDVQKN